MKTVREIYEFFLGYPNSEKKSVSLLEFLETIPEFNTPLNDGSGGSYMNISMGMEYLKICEKMCDDCLLIKVQKASVVKIDPHYIAVDKANSTNSDAFMRELEYGLYDYKYRGFSYIRDCFENSVLSIVGKSKVSGDLDIGTCYYIGDNMFVTAAHCVKDLDGVNILLPGDTPIELQEVWYAKDKDVKTYDLAVVKAKNLPNTLRAFYMEDPNVLDDVLTMGYPPIPGIDTVMVSEKASIASYMKAATGQVVANTWSYLSKLDHFIITARVKGGNSGSPVINDEGHVVGTVFQLPFDSQDGSDSGRYDIMGYGICLPSKYTVELINNPEVHILTLRDGFYKE